MNKVCLVLGAGRGIGATVAEKFALEGLHSHLCRRSDGDALQESLDQIQSKGGSVAFSAFRRFLGCSEKTTRYLV